MANKKGKEFESDIENSCKDQKIFYHRIKDIFIPPNLRNKIRVPKNKYDAFCFYMGVLFPLEFKSTKQKSISFDEKIIKKHQIDSLLEANKYDNTIPGFFFNFRELENKTYFVHINDFIKYKNIAENELPHTYKNRVNKSSIPIGIIQEIGVEVKQSKKKVRYRYYINYLLKELIGKYT